ncbi:ABC transporter permease [Actinoalloteichus caeruleus]|uniref:ABC transporter permease n=1 Tax=Actinoalloteichus cyanogriseus TaxID=2893586 RepID=UPI003AAA81D4
MSSAVVSPPARSGSRPGSMVRHGLILAGRSVAKIRKSPETLLDVTLQPILMLLMFVYLFGGAIAGSTDAYLQLVLPGLMVMIALTASLGTGFALSQDISKGVFDRFRSLPIARSAPLVGAVLGDIVRYAVSLAVLLGFGMLLGFRATTDPVSVLVAVLLVIAFGLSICWLSVLLAMLVRSPQAVMGMSMVVIWPLMFGSNIFAPTETMPGWLQAWVNISPITQLSDTARGLMIGGEVAGPMVASLLWMAGLLLVLFPAASWAYRRRLSRG